MVDKLSVRYIPQQNGATERLNGTLLDLVRAMLNHYFLEKNVWSEALAPAGYLRNRLTSHSLPALTTPHNRWVGSIPHLGHLRVFRCPLWYGIPREHVNVLDAFPRPTVFIEYPLACK